ncbi:MAG: glycosyltransferase family A protein [Anaerolineae bacterium]
MNPAIVISAYNRPHTLRRLLTALSRGEYPNRQVPLVISIDNDEHGTNREVIQVAEHFAWNFGPKRLICHQEHLGLVRHVYFCGGLAEEYGAVIFLEDDLGVSPILYAYASQALAFYDQDSRIAGLCLYALWFNGYTRQPFVPWADGADVFFVQVPYTQGQAWTRAQWKRFTDWRTAQARTLSPAAPIHDMFLHFDAEDWFPLMTQYVVETGQFYVYPRVSLTNAYGDPGTHFTHTTRFLQVPMLYGKNSFTFTPLDSSPAVYDSFFEMLPDRLNRLTEALRGFEYDVDLYATKRPRHLRAEYTLTSRRCARSIRRYGKSLWPQEANIVEQTAGEEIVLCRKEDLRWGWLDEIETRRINHDYFTRQQRLGKRTALQFALLDLIRRP